MRFHVSLLLCITLTLLHHHAVLALDSPGATRSHLAKRTSPTVDKIVRRSGQELPSTPIFSRDGHKQRPGKVHTKRADAGSTPSRSAAEDDGRHGDLVVLKRSLDAEAANEGKLDKRSPEVVTLQSQAPTPVRSNVRGTTNSQPIKFFTGLADGEDPNVAVGLAFKKRHLEKEEVNPEFDDYPYAAGVVSDHGAAADLGDVAPTNGAKGLSKREFKTIKTVGHWNDSFDWNQYSASYYSAFKKRDAKAK